jgi:Ni,Fe-hydrogenase I small subunit
MKDLKMFLALNEGRSMQMAIIDKENLKESTKIVACDSYSFIKKVNEECYTAINIDPISLEKRVVNLPQCAISDNVINLIKEAESK